MAHSSTRLPFLPAIGILQYHSTQLPFLYFRFACSALDMPNANLMACFVVVSSFFRLSSYFFVLRYLSQPIVSGVRFYALFELWAYNVHFSFSPPAVARTRTRTRAGRPLSLHLGSDPSRALCLLFIVYTAYWPIGQSQRGYIWAMLYAFMRVPLLPRHHAEKSPELAGLWRLSLVTESCRPPRCRRRPGSWALVGVASGLPCAVAYCRNFAPLALVLAPLALGGKA
jgi:hypothetical protein